MIEKKQDLNWRLFWNTRKELVLSILFFILGGMLILVGLLQQISPLQKAFQQKNNKQAEVDKYQTKADSLTQIASSAEINQFSEVDKVLPSHKPLLEILTNLNNVARSTQVVIKNFSLAPGELATNSTQVQKTTKTTSYDYLDLDFSVSGPLWRVQNFMTLIEQTTPISTITSIAINRDIDADKNAEAQANLVLRTFYFTQPIKTTITSPLPEVGENERSIMQAINDLIPADLENQTEVIKGDRGNLFGLQDITVNQLQQQLSQSSASATLTPTPGF